MQRWLSVANLFWLLAYAVLVAAICWAMVATRHWAMHTLSEPAAMANWEEFRDEAKRISEDGPVRRRIPPSSEPPTLRLLRDHFPASLAATLFFSTALFVTLMLLLRGAYSRSVTPANVHFSPEEQPGKPKPSR